MPATSAKQLRAMYAAKAGHSTLGIPKKVGAEFVKATPKKKRRSLMKGVGRSVLYDGPSAQLSSMTGS